jgi:hypothetical protein
MIERISEIGDQIPRAQGKGQQPAENQQRSFSSRARPKGEQFSDHGLLRGRPWAKMVNDRSPSARGRRVDRARDRHRYAGGRQKTKLL